MIPISRETLRGLKAKKDEEIRREKIKNCVAGLYRAVICTAETTTETSYKMTLPQEEQRYDKTTKTTVKIPEFHRVNIADILSGLKELLPDCTVELVTLTRGQDGQLYDISKMDEKFLQFAFHPSFKMQAQEYIVIDWS